MNTIKRTWKITNRCLKWWGIFLVFALLIAMAALLFGVLNLDVNLDLGIVNNVTSPVFALCFFAFLLFVIFYPIVFVLILPIAFLMNFRKKPEEKLLTDIETSSSDKPQQTNSSVK